MADLIAFGNAQRWLWATAAAGLIAELVFSSRGGGVFELAAAHGPVLLPVRALYHLRNSVFHPAHVSDRAGSGEAQIARLIVHLAGNSEPALAHRLDQSRAFLAQRPITEFAVRMLDAAGRSHPDSAPLVAGRR